MNQNLIGFWGLSAVLKIYIGIYFIDIYAIPAVLNRNALFGGF